MSLAKQLRELARSSASEGKRLALRVKRSEITRQQVQEAADRYGDIEPIVALEWLDKWGIR